MGLTANDVSVLIPAFNAEGFIDEAIESVMNQTVRVGEIIVVDDGSVDGTAARCEAWAPDVALIRQPNSGPGRARNAAVQVASGSILAFLDADDIWTTSKVELQLAYLATHPGDVAVFGWMQNFIDAGANLTVGPQAKLEAGRAFQASTMMMRRTVFDVVGPFDEIGPMQGWLDWYMRLHESALPVGMVEELVTMRRIHGDNMSLREHADKTELHRFLHDSLQRRRAQGSS